MSQVLVDDGKRIFYDADLKREELAVMIRQHFAKHQVWLSLSGALARFIKSPFHIKVEINLFLLQSMHSQHCK